ncbi:zonadhesin [Choloepus didactylus]|uniref:zonadhesin n=1 Tax=Choloepus didactylus TaxID=27675 RepID=UPI00189FE683|nr:zonadhesin [Choloepus didactylus]
MAPPVWTLVLLVGAACLRKEKSPDWKPLVRRARDSSVLTQCDFEDDYNPLCGWTQGSGDDGNWTRTKGSTPDDITRPQGGYPNGEGSYLHVDAPAIHSSGVVSLSSPTLLDSGPLCVHFAYHMFGRSWGARLKLLLLHIAGGSRRQLLWQQMNTHSASWMPTTVTVPAGIASPSRLIFEAVRGSMAYLDISLDAISVRRGSCDQVCMMQTCSFDVLNDFCGWSWVPTATGAKWIQKTGSSGQSQVGPDDDFSTSGKGSYLLLDPKDARPGQQVTLLSPVSQSPGCLSLTFHYTLRARAPGAGLLVFAKALGSIRRQALFSGKPGPGWQPVSVKFTGQGQIQFMVVGMFGVTPEPAVAVDAIGITPCGETFPQCDFEDDARPFCDWIQVSGDGGRWTRGNRSISAQAPHKGEHHYIHLEADPSSQSGKSVRLVSWPFCATEALCVELSYHMFGVGEGPTLQLLLGSPGGAASNSLWSCVGSQGSGWLHASVPIPAGHQQPMQLTLGAITGSSTTFDVAVGFISIRPGTCPEPVPTVLPVTEKLTVPPEKPTVPTMKPPVPTEKFIIPTTIPTFPPEEPTVPTEEPTISTEEPTIPTTKPTIPTEEPTVPTEEPTVPTTKPTIPTEEPTIPTEEPTIPTTKPTISTEEPTVPTTKPTVPTEEPTVPTEEPTIPTTKPTIPTKEPTVPTEEPTIPTTKPTIPMEEPTVPTEKPTVPTEEPTIPTTKPTISTEEPTIPAEQPTVPTEKPTVPPTEPTVPTMRPTVPMEEPTIPTVKPPVPTEKLTIPTTKPTIHTENPIVPTTKPTVRPTEPTISTAKRPTPLTTTRSPTLQPAGPAAWAITPPATSVKTTPFTTTRRPPVNCPPKSHYESCACHVSCQNPRPSCKAPCKPGCVCDVGFLLNGYVCIKASLCSCYYNTTFYKSGEEWLNGDCTKRCYCVGNRVKCQEFRCKSNEVCQEQNGQFRCYPQVGAATCLVYGNLHYLTFDGKPLTIIGKCTYILVQPWDNSTVPYFRVTTKMEERGREGISCLSKVYVTLSKTTITLLKGRHTLVGGQQVTLPAMPFQGVFLFLSGRFVALQTAFGLQMRWDGDQQLFISVPGTYFRKLSGICGNFDGDMNNDNQRPDGLPAKDEKELGDSWQTNEGEDKDEDTQCQSNQRMPPSCDEALQDSLPGPQLCGQLIDRQGPFEKCLPHLQASFYYKSCLFDMCNFQGLQQILCVHMAALTEACQAAGHMVKPWRSPQFCPLACPPNSKYSLCAGSCPKTCYLRFSAPNCPDRCVEGCECKPDFYLGGLQCLPSSQCGCEQSTGRYYLTGDDWYMPECKERCYCNKNRQIQCMNWKCKPPYSCVSEDGVYGCHTQASGICTVSGDPHVQTFDGALHHFMGSCTYTLTRTCWNVPPEVSFLVHITGEFRGGNLAISYVRIVHVQVFNIKFKLLRRHRVLVNDRRMALPLWAAEGRVSVALSGAFVLLRTNFGLWIRYDGFHLVEVTVPYHYSGRLCGLCGNFNKNRLDDNKGPEGKPAANSSHLTTVWMAKELSEPGCFPVGGKPPSCLESTAANPWSKDCGILVNPQGPFSQCHGLVPPRDSFDSCVHAQCGSQGDPVSLCRALQAYAALCAHAGRPVSWRNSTFCPMRCPPGSSYSPCTQPCPITCLSLNYPADCPPHLRCTEGCECQSGLVLSGTACVPIGKCGCTLPDGSYHPVGESWYSDRTCTRRCTCVSHSKVACSQAPCDRSRSEMCFPYDGLQTCRHTGKALCHVSAYPHYVSFDDSYHSFRGTCTYVLVNVCLPTMATFSFKITAKHERWGSQFPMVYVSQVNIYVFSARVTLEKDHRVLIDGREVSLPARTQIQGVSITTSGLYTVFATNFGLFVKFDGRHLLEIQVPQSNYNRLCGLCGNYNGEEDDELLMPSEELARNDIEFGNSWKEMDGTDPDCQPDNRDQLAYQAKLIENCNPASLARAQLHCRAAFQNPGWERCASQVPSRPFLFGCIHSFCELGDLTQAVCDALQNFDAACQAHGLRTLNWRNSSFCPLKCPYYSSYTPCAPSCQPSCEDPEGLCLDSKKASSCFEGCTCYPGYVLLEDQCVPRSQCSCRDAQGTTFTVGNTWLSPNCTKSCTCTRGLIQCRNHHCPFGAHCQLISKSRSECVPDWLDYCSIFGDPHYRTFDGVTYRFRGTMTYFLIKTVSSLPSGVEALSVEGRNKMYMPWSPVYLHDVLVEVYGYRVQLGPGLELVVNGEKMAIPFQPDKRLQVSLRAHRLYLTTDFKLGISFDGSDNAVFSLPSTYQGLVRGLCGNFDGSTVNEYLMPNNAVSQSSQVFGDSWEVKKTTWLVRARFPRAVQKEDPEEREEGERGEGTSGLQVSGCSPEQLELVNTTQACRVLMDPQGPFAACHQTVAPEPFQEHCVVDLCAARNPREREKMRCQILGGYATLCQEAGATLSSWRSHTRCPLACPANTVYQGCMTPCPASCASLWAPGDCEGPCVEGCAPVPGYVYSGTQTLPVADCGCIRDGVYYERGDSFVTKDCSRRCTCASLGVLRCQPFGCSPGELCTVANLTQGCFPDSPCLQNPCQNDGRCQEHGANFTCECEPGYTGALCTEPWEDVPPPGKPEAPNLVAVLLGMLVPAAVAVLAVTRECLHRKRQRQVWGAGLCGAGGSPC